MNPPVNTTPLLAGSADEPYSGVRLALEHVVQDVQNMEDLARRHAQAAHALSEDLAILAGAWCADSDWRNAPGVTVTVDEAGNTVVGVGGGMSVEDEPAGRITTPVRANPRAASSAAPMDAAGATVPAEGDGVAGKPAKTTKRTGKAKAVKPEPEPEPAAVAEPVKEYSLPEVRAVLADKARAGFMDEVRDLIQSYGVTRLSDIKPEDYAGLYARGKEIGDASK